ncbi:MAG: acetylxylan esterase, partial [Acidobacteria bacterium]|nr:acetylxylan esterase [Acidobacteriota bacterium]
MKPTFAAFVLAILAQGQVSAPTEQDYKQMLEQLRIQELRRGANGRDPQAPNAAIYDEAKVKPIEKLPDPLVLKNGK